MPKLLIRDDESVGEHENNSTKLMKENLCPQWKWDEDYSDSPRLEDNNHVIDKDECDIDEEHHKPGLE